MLAGSAVADLRIEVEGAPSGLADNIEAHFDGFDNEAPGPERAAHVDRRIRDAATAMGYYALEYQLSWSGDNLQIAVEPGPPVLWQAAQLQLQGAAASINALESTRRAAPFVPGTIATHKAYEDFKRRWLQQCRAEGFLDARYLDNRLLIDPALQTATAVLNLASGPRYHVAEISYSGSSLDTSLIERLSTMRTGDVFRRSDVNTLRRNLESSRYFKLIDIKTITLPGERIDIQVQLSDASRHDIGVGMGYDTDSGVRGRLRWDLPRLNRYGHTLHNEATISQPIQELSSTYRIPLSDPLEKSLNFTAAWNRRRVEDTHSTVTRVDARVIDQWWDDWIGAWGLGLYQETSKEGDEAAIQTSYLLPSTTLNHVVRHLVPDPQHGHSTWFNVAGSSQQLGADTEFLRLQAGYKRLLPLGGPHLLIGRAELGAIITKDILAVPLSQRFFTGGDQSVRGYELGSLSPRNSEGDPRGGQYLNVFSLEYSVKVLPSWRVGLFTDIGRAYDESSAPWHIGSGFGLRWLSPIGQVRVDVAFPVDDEFESGPRLHIFMGPLL